MSDDQAAPDVPDVPDHPVYGSFDEAERLKPGTVFYAPCTVVEVQQAEIIGDAIYRRLVLRSRDGERVHTLRIQAGDLLSTAQHARAHGLLMMFTGAFTPEAPLGTRPGRAALALPSRLRVDALTPLIQALPLLAPSPEELKATAALYDKLRQSEEGIYHYFLDTFYDAYQIASESLTTRQHRSLRLIAMQSVSCGQLPSDDHNPRLSILIASPPGRGKKPLILLAKSLANVYEFVQAPQSSAAGILAAVSQRGGAFQVSPGSLPRATRGTCVIDDAHRLPRNQLHVVEGGLMGVTEDGQLYLSKAGAARYEAECALLMTTNPRFTLPGMKSARRRGAGEGIAAERAADLGIPMDLLSRLDVMVWLDGDADPLDAAIEMAERDAFEQEAKSPVDKPGIRQIKLLSAYLRDRFPVVDLSQVRDGLGQAMADLGALLREATDLATSGLDMDSLVRRMSNSLRKLTGAAARLQGRGVATQEDVDEAFHMLTLKLEIVRWLAGDTETIRPMLPKDDALARAAQERALRQGMLRETYGGQKVNSARMSAETGIKEKVIRRDCWWMGMEPKDGLWAMPTEEQFELQQQVREQAAAFRRAEAMKRGEEPEEEVDHDAQVAELLRTLDDSAFAWEDPLPGLPTLRFRDRIPKLPVEARPFMKTLRGVEQNKQDPVVTQLINIVLHEQPPDAYQHSYYIENMHEVVPVELGGTLAWQLQPQINELLCHSDWTTRALWALAFLWESPLDPEGTALLTLRPGLARAQAKGAAPPADVVQAIGELQRRYELRERAEAAAAERGLAL